VRILTLATALDGLYQYLAWACQEIFPDTASSAGLAHHAALYGLTPVAASAASGHITVTGTPSTSVPSGLEFTALAGAVEGVTTGGGTLGLDGTLVVPATTTTLGAVANLDLGTAITLLSPPANVASAAVTQDGWLGGADQETDASLLARLLDRLRRPPAGGNQHDYEVWAQGVIGVAEAWCYPIRRGLGTVDVVVTSTDADRMPSASLLAAVQTYIDGVRPVTAKDFQVLAPTQVPVNVTVSVLAEPGWGADWTGTHTTAAGCTATELVLDSVTGLAAGKRIVVAEQMATIATVVDATHVILATALSAAPAAGVTVYPGGPLWQAIYDALHGYLTALTPPIFVPGGSYPITRTVYVSHLQGLVSAVPHVLDQTLTSPSGNVVATVDSTHTQMHWPGSIVITFQ